MPEPIRPIDDIQAEIIAEMAGLDDPLARYEYLVAQGDTLPSADATLHAERYAIPGCQVSVWVRVQIHDGRLHLQGDSDARINRGLVALLLRVLDGHTPAQVAAADLFFLDRTGLRTHLSPARANGLASLVQRIRQSARDYASSPD